MTTKPNRDDFEVLVHNPAELASAYVAWAERIHDEDGVAWGVPAIDRKVIPLRGGEMAVLVSRPGHCKTSLMVYHARQEAARIVARGTQDSEAVVYVSWEESAEELTKMLLPPVGDYTITDLAWGRVPMDVIHRQAAQLAQFPPVWVIGHGIERARRGKRAPAMTPEAVLGAIESMGEMYGRRPTLLLFDYVQRIPIQRLENKTQEVTEAVKAVNDLAMRLGCPCYVGAQARQEVDRRNDRMPTAGDAQWASAILQDADKFFAVVRPSKYLEPAQIGREWCQLGERQYKITENLLLLRLWKQRGDSGNASWALHFNPATLEMGETVAGEEVPSGWQDDVY